MASLERDLLSGRYRIRFRYDGQEFKRSLRTDSKRQATASLGQVEEVLRMLELGMTELPPDVDGGTFIVSGARVRKEKKSRSSVRTLDDLFSTYKAGVKTLFIAKGSPWENPGAPGRRELQQPLPR